MAGSAPRLCRATGSRVSAARWAPPGQRSSFAARRETLGAPLAFLVCCSVHPPDDDWKSNGAYLSRKVYARIVRVCLGPGASVELGCALKIGGDMNPVLES